ncbi:hypothetical protein ACZ11_08970 [Lysinibacillus xylanilyticus]|uniref:Uncharacterized protein n=1 Tax=Lysinibacillus xylanilyticus TaxID=582475 RepID=A0A0K9FDJ1_9BACI|nr:hypothetical protein [Lysinibacillus xylanilyticus]KMY32268.1 hypothetical protein ACZ11_08970 [Lysinibacillus xylanilyticus]
MRFQVTFQRVFQTSVPVTTLSVQKISTEIEELTLRPPRPVAIYLCESDSNTVLSVRKRSDSSNNNNNNNNNIRLSDQHHVGPKPPADVTELYRGLID